MGKRFLFGRKNFQEVVFCLNKGQLPCFTKNAASPFDQLNWAGAANLFQVIDCFII